MMYILTQYTYEKNWTKTSKEDALKIIIKEMPDTDADGTLMYVITEVIKGKIITLGTCRFKMLNNG